MASLSFILQRLACLLLLLGLSFYEGLALRGGVQIDEVVSETTQYVSNSNGGFAQATVRRLQDGTTTYLYKIQFIHVLPEGFVPADETLNEVRDGVRLTQIFFRRLFGREFQTSFEAATCEFFGTGNDIFVEFLAEFDRLVLFYTTDVSVTFRNIGEIPTPDEAFDIASNFDTNELLFNYIHRATGVTGEGGAFFPFVEFIVVNTEKAPTATPSAYPTRAPSFSPSSDSGMPSISQSPSEIPTASLQPSSAPTGLPSSTPSISLAPSSTPSALPTSFSSEPSSVPSSVPSSIPSDVPSSLPSSVPSSVPSTFDSSVPSSVPSQQPSNPGIAVVVGANMNYVVLELQFNDPNNNFFGFENDQERDSNIVIRNWYDQNLANSGDNALANFIEGSVEFTSLTPLVETDVQNDQIIWRLEITTRHREPAPTALEVENVMADFSANNTAPAQSLINQLRGVFEETNDRYTIASLMFSYPRVG